MHPNRPTPRIGVLRRLRGWKHLPFLTFLAGFALYSIYLQFDLSNALSRLFLARIFFQVVLAALVIASLRNVVGFRTLGMFGPAIIALAFLATGLPFGLLLLGLILGLVMLTRAAVIRERIQEAHRIAILVTTVSVTVSSLALVGLEFQQHQLFFAVLFPVLITAWMAERYVEQITRVGWEGPTKTLIWTLVAILVSFFVITQDSIVDFVLLNPLTWPVLVSLNWLLGTRVRFRLSERFRFTGIRNYALASSVVQGDFSDDVLTMNMRNRQYVSTYNPPDLMALLGKDAVKSLLPSQGIPMARTFLVLSTLKDLTDFKSWLGTHDTFALKPGSGYGGEGITLSRGVKSGLYETNLGAMDPAALESHAAAIIEGEYNGGRPDSAVVEELLIQNTSLQAISPIGLADIRVISFLGYPIMAMMRIPTKASKGKANLHAGAIGAGIRISTGKIIHAVWKGQAQPYHPDTGVVLLDYVLPSWDEILQTAAEAQYLTGLGFAGVDVALDESHGPVVMEVNRRPGLEIQNANAAGLLRRLKMVESLTQKERPVEERVRLVMDFDTEGWGIHKTP